MVAPSLVAAELLLLALLLALLVLLLALLLILLALLLLALLLEELVTLLLEREAALLVFLLEAALLVDFAARLLVGAAELIVTVAVEFTATAFRLEDLLSALLEELIALTELLAIVGLSVSLPTELLDKVRLIFAALERSILGGVAGVLLASTESEVWLITAAGASLPAPPPPHAVNMAVASIRAPILVTQWKAEPSMYAPNNSETYSVVPIGPA